MMPKKLVIIGGGFAGSEIAKELENDFQTTLIDNKDYFEYTPGILRAIVQPEHAEKLQVLHRKYLKKTKVIKEEVKEVHKNFIKTNNQKIPFDYLVIATGSRYKEPIKGDNMISSTRAKILKENNQELLKSKNILIIGGGIVGVELAGEIVTHHKNKSVTLVHSRQRLIPQENEKAAIYAEKFLKNNNVKIIFNERVTQFHKDHYHTKNRKIKSDLTFLCIGITPNSKIMDKNFKDKLDQKKCIKVNHHLQLQGVSNIFVAGDVSSIKEEKLAQNAEIHAKIVIENIKNLEENKPLKSYNPKPKVIITSLGKHKGILTYKELTITGFIPAVLKSMIESWVMKRYK